MTIPTNPTHRRLGLVAAGLLAGTLVLGACSDDSSDAGSTTTVDAGLAAFCEAELAAEAAISSEAPDAEAKTDAMLDAAPDEIRSAIEEALANAESGAGDPAFDEAYGELMAFMVDECGAQELTLTVADDGFDGLPSDVDAGPTVIAASNDGTTANVVLLLELPEGTSAADLDGMTPDELFGAGTTKSGAFLAPGISSYLISDLAEGSYAVVRFDPEGDGTVAGSHELAVA